MVADGGFVPRIGTQTGTVVYGSSSDASEIGVKNTSADATQWHTWGAEWTAGQVVFSMMGAYAFARMEFPGRDALFWMYLATLMVPNVVTLVPLYVMFAKAGLLNTYCAIFLPYTLGVPQAVFLMRQNFMTIPKEVMEAARLDGCSESRILWRIVVPISKPIIITASHAGRGIHSCGRSSLMP